MGGHALDEHGRGSRQVNLRRERHNPLRRNGYPFGISAQDTGVAPGNPVADGYAAHLGPDRGDNACGLMAGEERERFGHTPAPLCDVGEVDSARGHVDNHLARVRLRIR